MGGGGAVSEEDSFSGRSLSTSAAPVLDVTLPVGEVIWKERSTATPMNHRPVSREILQPEVASFHSKLSKKRRIELRDRIKNKVAEISEKIQKAILEEKEEMDSRNIFHPKANAQRAHTQLIVRLQKSMQPDQIQELVLKEMIRDDGRDLTDAEIEDLEERFGKMFQGTAFDGVIQVNHASSKGPKQKQLSPGVALAQELEKRGVRVQGSEVFEGEEEMDKTVGQLKDRGIMSFDEFKASGGAAKKASSPGSRPSTRGESDTFRDFMHVRTLTSKSGQGEGKETLAFNSGGLYSGMLAAGEKNFAPLICEDVADKLWNDSERTGRRPNYSERHSSTVGFTSNFVDKTGDGIDEGGGGE